MNKKNKIRSGLLVLAPAARRLLPLFSAFVVLTLTFTSCQVVSPEQRVVKLPGQAGIAIKPPEEVAFNWPLPPKEGEKDYFTIAENGQARCCIVIPAGWNKAEDQAAQTLLVYLKLATGAEFARYKDNEVVPDGIAQIHVGETKKAKQVALDLPPVRYGDFELPNISGYLIKTADSQTLVLRGATPRATIFAVVGFLKRYVGVRRYWPGEPGGIGDIVPRQATLKLPQIEWRDWPYFISVYMSGLDNRGPQNEISKNVRFADFWRIHQTIRNNESYCRLMKANVNTNHPEYFPLIQGKRFVATAPASWQPCISNPKVVEIMAESIKENFRKDPLLIGEALSVNDGWGDCRCAQCCAMDPPNTDLNNRIGLCDRYVKFDNQVADLVVKEFPDRVLAFIAYGSMSSPPTTVKLHPMLMPVLCLNEGNSFKMWDEWNETGAKLMGFYQYRDGAGFVLPKFDMRHTAKQLRYFVAGEKACHIYHPINCTYPLDGMVGYIQAEMTWDPRIKEDALLAEYYDKFYGNAAKPMRTFYETVETAYEEWLDKVGEPHPYGKDICPSFGIHQQSQFEVLPKEAAINAQKQLEAALKAAGNDKVVCERVQLVKTIFDFVALGTKEYWAGRRLRENPAKSMEDAQKAIIDAREAVDSGLAFAAYKFDVMEKPPVKAYTDRSLATSSDGFYNNIQPGSVYPVTFDSICRGFDSVSSFLRASLGAEKAQAWWQQQQKDETRPVLTSLMNVAVFMASGRTPENLVKDSSFEQRGEASVTNESAGKISKDAIPEAQRQDGIMGGGSLFNRSFSTEESHSGKYSIVFWESQSGWIAENMSAKEGDILRISVWVKQEGKMKGFLEVSARNNKVGKITEVTEPIPNQPGKWQKIELFFPVPAGATVVVPAPCIQLQAPGAKAWMDDFCVYKYSD